MSNIWTYSNRDSSTHSLCAKTKLGHIYIYNFLTNSTNKKNRQSLNELHYTMSLIGCHLLNIYPSLIPHRAPHKDRSTIASSSSNHNPSRTRLTTHSRTPIELTKKEETRHAEVPKVGNQIIGRGRGSRRSHNGLENN